MKKTFKRVAKLAGISALLTGAYAGISKLVFNKAFKDTHEFSTDELLETFDARLKDKFISTYNRNRDWFINSKVAKASIKSLDGYVLNGEVIENHEAGRQYVILVHGYNVESHSLLEQAYHFDRMGYNVLIYDQRGFGASKSTNTTLGWQEQFDLIKWIEYLVLRVNEVKIALYGVSMGATSILMALGNELDKHVKVAISDSAYAKLKDMVEEEADDLKTFMPFVMPGLKFLTKQELNFNIDDVDVFKLIDKAKLPILIIHSQNDDVINYEYGVDIYNEYPAYKEFYLIDDCKHAYACYEEGYFDRIGEFFNKFMR